MSSTLKTSGALQLKGMPIAPANPQAGLIYFDSSDLTFKMYDGTSYTPVGVQTVIDSMAGSQTTIAPSVNSVKNYIAGLTTSEIAEGTQLYFTEARARAAAVINDTSGSQTNVAPSVSSMKAYVADQIANVDLSGYLKTDGTTPMEANLDMGTFSITNADVITSNVSIVTGALRTGNIVNSGNSQVFDVDAGMLKDQSAVTAINLNDRVLKSSNGADSSNWEQRELKNSSGEVTVNWQTKRLINGPDQDADKVLDWSVSGEISVASKKITNLSDGTASTDAVNKGQLDSAIAGIDLSDYVAQDEKGAANGVATLDANSLIPVTQLPPAAIERLVIVADEAARFALTTATVQNGDTVKQTDTGAMYFVKDDTNLDNATGYEVYTAGAASTVAWSGVTGTPTTLDGYGITDAVKTVNNEVPDVDGNVSLTTGFIPENGNLYFTNARAQTAAVINNTTGTQANQAASVNAMKLYVSSVTSGFISSVEDDTAPKLGGQLDTNGKDIYDAQEIILNAPQVQRTQNNTGSDYVSETYVHGMTLAASQTDAPLTDIQIDAATFDAVEITYKLKDSVSGSVRLGTIRITHNGSDVAINDVYTELDPVDVS